MNCLSSLRAKRGNLSTVAARLNRLPRCARNDGMLKPVSMRPAWTSLKWSVLALLVAICMPAVAESTESIRQRSVDYVLSHPQACVVTHGYLCQSIDEASLQLNQQLAVPAIYLLAWPVAYADFKSLDELNDAQKDLHHYTVGFAENEQNLVVILNAVLLPALDDSGEPNGQLLRSTLGRSMRYEIDRQSLAIVSRKFYR